MFTEQEWACGSLWQAEDTQASVWAAPSLPSASVVVRATPQRPVAEMGGDGQASPSPQAAPTPSGDLGASQPENVAPALPEPAGRTPR